MEIRRRTGSTLCPTCGQLVGVGDDRCLNCGRARPGLFGFTHWLHRLGRDDMGFAPLVLFACGALYIASVAPNFAGPDAQPSLSPASRVLLQMGASGALPVFGLGRWWTPLSAGWLHGGIIHIFFNMMSARDLIPLTAHLYGGARTAIIYVLSSVAGFLASTLAGAYIGWLPFIGGGRLTIGASAALFGLIGAALHYGRRGGSTVLLQHAKGWAVGGLAFGFLVPGIDNWAHIGGLAAGYAVSRWLDPLQPERGDHVIAAVVCLAASAAAVVASLVSPSAIPVR